MDIENVGFINSTTVLEDYATAADGGTLYFKLVNDGEIVDFYYDGKIMSVNRGVYYVVVNGKRINIDNAAILNDSKLKMLNNLVVIKYGLTKVNLPIALKPKLDRQ
jgi:hypothetical protein